MRKFAIYAGLFILSSIFIAEPILSQEISGRKSRGNGNGRGNINPWHREYDVIKINEPPKIDGKLDDPIWQTVEFSGKFLQREPSEGIPASERTEIAIAYDDNNLYIAARCYDSDPSGIKATEMRRDQYLWDDDYLEIILDTFDDGRSSFYFTTNPLGARSDGKTSDEGKNNNRDWDGVWHCKSSINEDGWYTEIAIPWQTLRFQEGDGVEWNANFLRTIKRKNESDYWRLISRDYGHSGKYRMSEGGRLRGFNNLKMGGKYEFLPYFSGGLANDESTGNKTNNVQDMGLDVKWNISSTMTADFTYNTDFAQVEADQERVNLTRFSLYFPEKRQFFLEGAENFRFGQGSGRGWRPSAGSLQIFYSRRVGLESGYQVPIMGGSRIQGKSGKYTIGIMSIQTDKSHLYDDDDTGDGVFAESTNYSVVRVKRDLFLRSSIGLMMLNKQQEADYNRTVGFDSYFPITNTFSFYVVGAGTFDPKDEEEPESKRNRYSGNIGFNYNSDLWEYSMSYVDIEDGFNPEMGFIRRTDIKRTSGRLQFSPRPRNIKSIRQFEFQVNGEYQNSHDNLTLNRKVGGEFQIRFENSSNFSIGVEREYEFLDYDWEVRDGYVIAEDGYNTTTGRISYRTDRSKFINGNIRMNGGDYFDGSRYGGSLSGDIKLFNKFRGNLNYSYNWVDLPDGEFHTNSLSARLSYSFNPDLYVKAYLQLLDDKLRNDGQYEVSTNVLFHYIYKPGSDFYIVFNEGRMTGNNNTVIENRTLLTKFTYFLRK